MESKFSFNTDPITLSRFLTQQQQQFKESTGDFTLLINSIAFACKWIANKVKKAGIANLLGKAGSENATGDSQKKLDVISDEVFISALKNSNKVAVMVSEEQDKAILVDIENQGKYVVTFDPLDGSSNIDANVSIGSIFGIWKRHSPLGQQVVDKDFLRTGTDMVCAGYCLYGSSVHFLLTTGKGSVNGFTLDPAIGEFTLTHPDIKIPPKGTYYSINEGNTQYYFPAIKAYIHQKKYPANKKSYSARYIGSMVADVHRTLLYGGIFLYPSDKKSKNGKLRVLYEVFPMAFIMEQAGGKAISEKGRLLDIQVTEPHQRSGVILGSIQDVTDVQHLIREFAELNEEQQKERLQQYLSQGNSDWPQQEKPKENIVFQEQQQQQQPQQQQLDNQELFQQQPLTYSYAPLTQSNIPFRPPTIIRYLPPTQNNFLNRSQFRPSFFPGSLTASKIVVYPPGFRRPQ